MTKHFCDLCGREVEEEGKIEYTTYRCAGSEDSEEESNLVCCKTCDKKMKARVAALGS